jgi:hypothetical protein
MIFNHDQLTNINFCCLVRLSGNETNLKTGAIKTLGGIQMLNFAAPYNYLSPASYVPCKAGLLSWQNETTDICCFGDLIKEAPILDEITSRRLEFLRCFVHVNNLSKPCCPEQLVGLFIRLDRYGAGM